MCFQLSFKAEDAGQLETREVWGDRGEIWGRERVSAQVGTGLTRGTCRPYLPYGSKASTFVPPTTDGSLEVTAAMSSAIDEQG
jgi:hypothetical protein